MSGSESECGCAIARVYALTQDELDAEAMSCVAVDDSLNRVSIENPSGGETRVTVDHAFRDTIPIEDLYQDALYPYTESLFTGHSTIIFNFGKDKDRARFLYDAESDDQGIINLAAEQIFTNVKASSGSGVEFLVHTAIFHVRKDKVLDALAEGSSRSFSVKERKGERPEVKGIKQEEVVSQEAFDTLYERSLQNQPSNAIRVVVLTVEVNEPDTRGNDSFRQGSLYFVDVCEGMASADKTKLVGILAGLAEGMKPSSLPFSDFKLGKFLKYPLGGRSKIVFVGHVRESDKAFHAGLEGVKLLQLCSSIRTSPSVEKSAHRLQAMKKEISDLKAAIHKKFESNVGNREKEIQNEQNARQSALQKRLAQRAKDGNVKSLANMTEEEKMIRPKIVYEEKVVEKEVVVEKEKLVHKVVEVVDKKQMGIQEGLNELNDTVRAHQEQLEKELNQKQQHLQEKDIQRQEAEKKLQELQQRVLGMSGGAGGEAPDVILAKQQKSYRDAQFKLQQQQKKEQKLEQMRKQIEGEQKVAEKELKEATAAAAKQKDELNKIKADYDKKLKEAKREQQKLDKQHTEHTRVVREQVQQQEANIKLLTQIAEYFLAPTELSKVWEKSKFDEQERRWQLPVFRPRNEWSDVRLPDKSGIPAKLAIESAGHLLGSNPETGAIGPRLRQPAPQLPEGWRNIAGDGVAGDEDGNGGGGGGFGREKLAQTKQKAKDKLKQVKKVNGELVDGVVEIQSLLQESVGKIQGSDPDISAAMALLRKCVSICDKGTDAAAGVEDDRRSSSSKSKSKH